MKQLQVFKFRQKLVVPWESLPVFQIATEQFCLKAKITLVWHTSTLQLKDYRIRFITSTYIKWYIMNLSLVLNLFL